MELSPESGDAGPKSIVLITGASGFIAGSIVKQALADGYKVRGTVRSLSNPDKYKYLTDMGDVELVPANLNSDEGWDEAMAGVRFVLHVASLVNAGDVEAMGRSAVEGTQRILEAANRSPTIERVVCTSSSAAVSWGFQPGDKESAPDYKFSWKDHSPYDNVNPYAQGKLRAEEFAFNFANEHAECKFDIVVVIPGSTCGPVLNDRIGEMADMMKQIMLKEVPMVPHIQFGWCDVRDIALVQVRCLTVPEAAGKRLVCAPHSLWMSEVGQLMYDHYSPDGWNPTTGTAPSAIVYVMSKFDGKAAFMVNELDKTQVFDCSETEELINITWRPVEGAIFGMVDSMIEFGMIVKPEPKDCAIL